MIIPFSKIDFVMPDGSVWEQCGGEGACPGEITHPRHRVYAEDLQGMIRRGVDQ